MGGKDWMEKMDKINTTYTLFREVLDKEFVLGFKCEKLMSFAISFGSNDTIEGFVWEDYSITEENMREYDTLSNYVKNIILRRYRIRLT